jgi:uncharacterized membrane protein
MPDQLSDSYVFPPLDEATLSGMLEAAKVATAPRIRRWQDRLADRVARFCGSWTFILAFSGVVVVWVVLNSVLLATHAFDPYPYVFLNLCLTVAMSLQGPLILMSQSRQNKQNRRESVAIYALSLKAEKEGTQRGLELAHMESKLDEVLVHIRQQQVSS